MVNPPTERKWLFKKSTDLFFTSSHSVEKFSHCPAAMGMLVCLRNSANKPGSLCTMGSSNHIRLYGSNRLHHLKAASYFMRQLASAINSTESPTASRTALT